MSSSERKDIGINIETSVKIRCRKYQRRHDNGVGANTQDFLFAYRL